MSEQQNIKQRFQIVDRGPVINQFKGAPVCEYLKTADGVFWLYERTLPEPDPDNLNMSHDECWVYPGLLYRRATLH